MQFYHKNNPFLASIKDRYNLCGNNSIKKTHHLVIDLSGSNISYSTGDSIAILPTNDPIIVQKTMDALGVTGEEVVKDRNGENSYTLKEFITKQVNITDVSHKLFNEIHQRQKDSQKKLHLDSLRNGEREFFKQFLASTYLCEILFDHKEASIPLQELCNLLTPILPRFYSIASSQKVVGDEVHLTVALKEYGEEKVGICTHYLCNRLPMESWEVPVYVQPHNGFTLPEDGSKNIIMIGPGTGIAPFRAFMQERVATNAKGKNWLFFGEWNRHSHFFYQSFWEDLVNQGKLRLDLAFSRDQPEKIYVQHRMLEQGKELFRWIKDGSYLYVCGDAKRMAKDVEATLLQIISTHGNMDEAASRAYLKALREEKRYLRDVY